MVKKLINVFILFLMLSLNSFGQLERIPAYQVFYNDLTNPFIHILGSNLQEILVLVPLVIMTYKISSFIVDYKSVIDVQTKLVSDIFTNFELHSEKRGRKVDLDLNLMIKNSKENEVFNKIFVKKIMIVANK